MLAVWQIPELSVTQGLLSEHCMLDSHREICRSGSRESRHVGKIAIRASVTGAYKITRARSSSYFYTNLYHDHYRGEEFSPK